MSAEKTCGCKGIRTCLLCEKYRNDVSKHYSENEEIRYVYTYCPQCNLCWPDNEDSASLLKFPLYVGKIKMCLDFFSENEEAQTISEIDKIPWMPSQSGRRKQDFGPKVNFKKKKVKVDEFKGFPRFTEGILPKFQDVPELSDFKPVELCHLEYSPERGSSIDPHVDDFWLWGERLVTINLGSSTVLTLVPCSDGTCDCHQQATCDYFQSNGLVNGDISRTFSCNHKFQDILMDQSMKALSANENIDAINRNTSSEQLKLDTIYSASTTDAEEFLQKSSLAFLKNNIPVDVPCAAYRLNPANSKTSNDDSCGRSSSLSDVSKSHIKDVTSHKSCQYVSKGIVSTGTSANNFTSISTTSTGSCKDVNVMCSVFRTGVDDLKVAVRIVLPPRSLLVLAGCARYNWFHEIKRQDVVSRRLAMTFRELTEEFLDGGKGSELGKDLLAIANKFYDLL